MHFVSPYQTQQTKVLGATGQAQSHKIQVLPTYYFTLWDKEKKKSDLTELNEMTTIYLLLPIVVNRSK